MSHHAGNHGSELEAVIAGQRLSAHVEALALTVFSGEELGGLAADQRKVLDMLFKRRMRDAGADLSLEDCLRVRLQFDQYADNRVGDPRALRLAAQLR